MSRQEAGTARPRSSSASLRAVGGRRCSGCRGRGGCGDGGGQRRSASHRACDPMGHPSRACPPDARKVVAKEGVSVTEAGTQPLRCSLHAAQHPRRSPLLRRWAALPIRQNPSTAAAATETAKAAAAAAPGTGGTKAGAATSAIAAVAAAAVTAASSGGGASAAAVLHQYHFDSCARVGPEGALLSTSVPALHAIDGYLVFNLFRLTPASADRLRGGTTARPTRQSLRATPA